MNILKDMWETGRESAAMKKFRHLNRVPNQRMDDRLRQQKMNCASVIRERCTRLFGSVILTASIAVAGVSIPPGSNIKQKDRIDDLQTDVMNAEQIARMNEQDQNGFSGN